MLSAVLTFTLRKKGRGRAEIHKDTKGIGQVKVEMDIGRGRKFLIAGCSVMLVFLFTISSTMANKEKMETNSTQSDQENPLDAEFHKAMKESGTSTASMIQILNEYAGKWKTEMETSYEKLKEAVSPFTDALENNQTLWEEYADSQNQLIYKIAEQAYGGESSYLGLLYADLEYQKYRERVEELHELFESAQTYIELTGGG